MEKKVNEFVYRHLSRFVRFCPKTGRIIGFPKKVPVIFFPIVGILAIVWFLIRTGAKPYRASYPCQKIAAGIGISFLVYLAGIFSSLALFAKLKKVFKNLTKPGVAVACIAFSIGMGFLAIVVCDSFITDPPLVYADWNPTDAPNTPIGTAQGINPGRVTWDHNADATAENYTGNWWQPGNTNQQVVKNMFADSIKALTGKSDVASSWDALFKYYNQKKGKGNVGYASGETIAIKINHVNTYMQDKWNNSIDVCAETLFAVVDQLVASAGVPQNNIIVYDGGVGTIATYVYNCVTNVYPNIQFRAANVWGNIQAEQWVDNGITYSSMNFTDADARRVAKTVWDATYLVNLANLKKHENQTAVTLCGKNHFGSIKTCSLIHAGINDQTKGMGTYNPLVDLQGHQKIGGKTVLYIIDGLWGSAAIDGQPVKWQSAPFNNDYPSSIFMSEDPVAIDSVGLDFINMEHTLWANADNYLHEMAKADNPPSGVFYDPEADGTRMQSLGAHEHWNNTQAMQYSRNLGTGSGIELTKVGQTTGVLLGDANNNGTVDIVDALIVAQYYVGLNPAGFVAANADVNKDGKIDIVDALKIAQCYVGLVSCSF